MHGDIDDVKTYLDDAIEAAKQTHREQQSGSTREIVCLAEIAVLHQVRKEIEWIEHEGYISHRDCARDPDNACDDCLNEWANEAEPA